MTLDPAWFDAIEGRISRRRFTGELPTDAALSEMRTQCDTFRAPWPGSGATARAVLVERAPADLFTGLVGSYGRIEDAPSAALLIGREGTDLAIGYVGEAFVLEAARLGLDTCWIAGAFSRTKAAALAQLSPGEVCPAIVALGIARSGMGLVETSMRTFVRASSRVSAETIALDDDLAAWPTWALSALQAVRRAPSGGNSQPWRLRLEAETLVLSEGGRRYRTAVMDHGIAMLHLELGASHAGVEGTWEFLEKPDVARFTPTD